MRFSVLMLIALAAPAIGQTSNPQAALLRDYHFRSIGPAAAGGRVTDVRGLDSDPRIAVVATAGGGAWKTEDMGLTWTPIFQHYGSSAVGAVAIFQRDPNIIWVGTGEANNRNDVLRGDGVYKSTDGGATFTKMGLDDTYTIARVVTHPTDPNVVYVAATGDLWGYRGRRGVFKTNDGGRTWQQLTHGLPNDSTTGATDLVMDAANPEVLYVAFYQRLRRPWRFESGGADGGIFKTSDGGAHWTKLTDGLPEGPTGRIGLAISRSNPRVVMAVVEASFGWQCAGRGAANEPSCASLAQLGSGVYRSEDGGAHWTFENRYDQRPFYFSQIRIDPKNDQHVFLETEMFQESHDGGRTFQRRTAPFGPNYDYHALWIDPNHPDRFYVGGDKGLALTQDGGKTLAYLLNLPIEQFYKVATDSRDPYAIYGGLQDDGSWGTMSFTRDVVGIRSSAAWKMHWDDGQYAAVDPSNWRVIYSEGTQGTFRVVDPIGHTDSSRRATPRNITNFQPATGTAPEASAAAKALRFNWTTPFIISPHDPARVYYGSNYLLTSTDEGQHWTIVSPDLSKHDPSQNQVGTGGLTPDATGAEGYATIYTISESPLEKGLIWAGTDDGNLWLTRDGGGHWSEVDRRIPDVPSGLWVSRVEASAAEAGTAYVTFDWHRSDNYQSWLFKTTDYGKHWTDLSPRLARHGDGGAPVYCVLEDAKNPNLLFLGTEYGLEVSFDAGQSWAWMDENGLPTAAVYDAIIQPRDRDLILATHGHGIFILDDITALEQWKPALAAEPVHVFQQRRATLWVDMSPTGQTGSNVYAGQNPPDVRPPNPNSVDRQHIQDTPVITVGFGAQAAGEATLAITSPGGQTRTVTLAAQPGITRYVWDGRMEAPRARGRGGRGA
ncbi:MAG: WD40/YVTN/BNR-like repeat-containing protein, partial [Terriglobales bacterium]